MQRRGPEAGRKWIFLHGLMGFSSNWLKIVSALQGTENCLVFDQRGHGRSFKPTSGYGAANYAQDLWEITEALGWDRFVLVGHSMGGRNALVFAGLHPEKVEKLVLEDISPEVALKGHEYYENLLNLVPTPFASREAAKAFFQTEFLQKAKTRENAQILSQFLYANLYEQPDGAWDWRFSKPGIIASVVESGNQDYWKILTEIKRPTLMVRGEKSPEFSKAAYEKALHCSPLVSGVEISNAGHWVHADQPQLFTDVLKDFVGIGTRTFDS